MRHLHGFVYRWQESVKGASRKPSAIFKSRPIITTFRRQIQRFLLAEPPVYNALFFI